MEPAVKRIGVLTSGGDAPGMNAAVRAVVRSCLHLGIECIGIRRGYHGLVNGDVFPLDYESSSGLIRRGGTILYTARSEDFQTEAGQAKAASTCKFLGLDGVIAVGGDGTFRGLQALSHNGVSVVGIPGTIDNDLYGTDTTIGYDTALNTIVDCVDKIRDTATSHDRIFFVEVMGRDAGFLTQNSAIASGAEAAIIPEDQTDVDQLARFIGRGIRKSKNSSIVLVSEARKEGEGGAMYYAERVRKEYPQYDVRVTILGHLQRGGTPSAYDRILASRLGYAAIEALDEGQRNIMVGIDDDNIVYVPLNRAIKFAKPINKELIDVLSVLSI